MPHHTSRRSLLRVATATAAAAVVGPSMLTACSSGVSSGGPSATSAADLPNYTPYAGVKPDLVAKPGRANAGYFSYPADPVRIVTKAPGDGKPVSGILSNGNVVLPVGDNLYWQGLNKRLGSELKLQMVPGGDEGYYKKGPCPQKVDTCSCRYAASVRVADCCS
ncbi:hypothetical protein [Streptomyces sp. NPDC047981]|uniref:hypothetical protein n=1 Tax=Streptomyces sp. NPDC047981 TaxID=3154610 RepID=UPI00341A0FEF